MSKIRNIFLVLLFFYITSLNADDQLSPITVSASRTPVTISESGSSVTIINQQEIQNRQVPFVADLLRDAPGVAISQNGGAGTLTQLRLRGAEANHTLVLIDGIEANDVAIGSEFDFANLLSCGLESIEVLRGPQSSLWGSDALAGVVNVQTIKGSGPLKVESTFSSGRFDTRQNCTGISAGNNLHNFSLYGAYFENNGTNISEFGSENDGYRNTTFNVNYGVNPTNRLSFNLIGRHTDTSVETDDFEFNTIDFTSKLIDADMNTDTIQNYFRFNSQLDTFNGAFSHTANISLTDSQNKNFTSGDKSSETEGQKLKFDYQASLFHSTDNTDHTLTFAFERERERFEQMGTASFFGDPNQRQKIYNSGYIAEYNTGFLDQWYINASIRKDNNDEFENRTTYRIATAYNPKHSNISYHAAYGSAVKNPSFTERFGFTPDTFIGNPDLKPEKSTGWEAGVTYTFSNIFELSATVFSEELEDEINGFFFDPTLGPFGSFTAINLEGESVRKGLEFSFSSVPLTNLELTGSYTYINSRQPDSTGKTSEIRVPGNTASLIANYEFLADRANLNLKINYVGDQFDNNFGVSPSARESQHDYTLVNIAGEYEINQWLTIQGRIENLFDTEYQDVIGFETQGINAHIGIKFQSNTKN